MARRAYRWGQQAPRSLLDNRMRAALELTAVLQMRWLPRSLGGGFAAVTPGIVAAAAG